MAIQAPKGIPFTVWGDGVSTIFSISVSDLCTFANQPDISPVDGVVIVGGAVQFSNPNLAIPCTVALNSKGTIVTFTFSQATPNAMNNPNNDGVGSVYLLRNG